MIKLLGFWLAWRAIRVITAIAVVVAVLALLISSHPGVVDRGNARLTQLRHATRPFEQQLERTIQKAFRP
jgi:hypothetical protein